jgi:hypothetical protein
MRWSRAISLSSCGKRACVSACVHIAQASSCEREKESER